MVASQDANSLRVLLLSLLARTLRGDYDASLMNFDQVPDPDDFFAIGGIGLEVVKFRETGFYVRQDNTQLADLITKARQTLDQNERRDFYWQAMDIVGGDMLNAGIVQSASLSGWTKKLKNVRLWADRDFHAEELAIEA